MAKADVVAAGIAALAQAQSDAFGVAYDSSFSEGVASVPATSGGDPTKIFSQSDLDAAVAAAQGVDQAALQQAQSDAAAALQSLQASFDALTSKEAPEAAEIESLKGSAVSLQQALDLINASINPPPAPAPVPAPVDPAPVDPAQAQPMRAAPTKPGLK